MKEPGARNDAVDELLVKAVFVLGLIGVGGVALWVTVLVVRAFVVH